MNMPSLEELRKAFPNRIPDDVTAVTYLEGKPAASKDNSFIEWIGYWKGFAVGVRKFFFGSAGWVQIVVSTVALFTLFMTEPVQKPLNEFYEYSKEKVSHSEFVQARYINFGDLPDIPDDQKHHQQNQSATFPNTVITASVSGSWPGLG